MSVAAIILAAGLGSRFGEDSKLLAPLDGKPLVRHVAEAALASAAAPVLVVVGHRAKELSAAIRDLGLRHVENPRYAEGLASSLNAGFAALPAEAEAAVILLGDMPRVAPATIDALISTWIGAGRPSAVVPTRAGRRGNPVLLARSLEPDLSGLAGDAGAGALLRSRADVVELAVDDASILTDVDTPDALASLSRGSAHSRTQAARPR